jgi:muramoyltetrapeptide carboxypeptidase
MSLRVPSPLALGATLGVTAPSSGVPPALRPRYDFCEAAVRRRGYEVRQGSCLFAEGIVSAPAQPRAAELVAMMTDDSLAAVIPPWGGELLIELLPLLDFELLARAPAKWFVGWSDCTTFMLPLLTRARTMSLHGMNFMDTPFAPAPGAAGWQEVLELASGAEFVQTGFTHHQGTWKSYLEHPDIASYEPVQPTRWRLLGAARDVRFEGRLVGGCADVLSRLAGTPFGEVDRFAQEHAPEGVVVYLENCEMTPPDAARCWHQLVLAGWFRRASGVLIGRTPAPDTEAYTQHAAIADAFGGLDVPVLYDVDIGHQPPQMLVVNGAQARVTCTAGGRGELAQRLG